MKEEAIIAILNLRLKKLNKHVLKLREGFDLEELHDCRLEMKKLKAFLRLLNTHCTQHEKIKLNQSVETYYKLTGNLRNLQLHEQRIQAWCSEQFKEQPVAYLALLETEKEKVIEQLRAMEQKISFKKLHSSILSQAPLKLEANKCKDYLVNQRNALLAILVPASFNDDALHEVRKIVKGIGYNRDYLGSFMSLFLPALLVKKEISDCLAEKLGVFHDLCVSQYLLQLPAVLQIKEQNERLALQEMQCIIECKKKQAKEEVLQQLADL